MNATVRIPRHLVDIHTTLVTGETVYQNAWIRGLTDLDRATAALVIARQANPTASSVTIIDYKNVTHTFG
jgi:hypothetical protein